MKRAWKTAAVHLCLWGLSALGNAHAANSFTPCRPGAAVVYMNGVSNFNEQASIDNARRLQESIAHFGVSCVAEVQYLYNPSVLLGLTDLTESALQKATELGIGFSDALLQVGFVVLGMTSPLPPAEQERIRTRVASLIQGITLSTVIVTEDGALTTAANLVADFRNRVLSNLSQGTKTVLVAHSQGNFFANETDVAVRAATPSSVSQGLAVVNVANPSLNAPNGLWATATEDLVIFALGALALPANTSAAGAYAHDPTGHGFGKVYLNRSLPLAATEAQSIAGTIMELTQQALNIAQTPVVTMLGSTSSSLFEINLATNSVSVLGNFTFTNSPVTPIWDIALNPNGGPRYALTPTGVHVFNASDLSLYRLPGSNVGGNALAFNADGELYGMGGNRLYRFDSVGGEATALPISLGSLTSSGDLAFDGEGAMFGTAYGATGIDSLVRIDLNRSTVTVVGSTGYANVWGLYFSGGYLFGVTSDGALLNIDRLSGSAQRVRQIPLSGITGLQ